MYIAPLNVKIEARTERRNWTELTRFSFWRTDQRSSKASPLVIGWRVTCV